MGRVDDSGRRDGCQCARSRRSKASFCPIAGEAAALNSVGADLGWTVAMKGLSLGAPLMERYGGLIETIKRSAQAQGFVLLPRRWVVERTFAWGNWCRRLSKDDELLPHISEAMIQVAMSRVRLKQDAST